MSAARVLALTPQGHLVLAPSSPKDAQPLPGNLQARVEVAFARGVGHALLELGIREVGTALPPDFAYCPGAWFSHAQHSDKLLCFLKGVKIVSTLNASLLLVQRGYVQEAGALYRIAEDCVTDILFFILPLNGTLLRLTPATCPFHFDDLSWRMHHN